MTPSKNILPLWASRKLQRRGGVFLLVLSGLAVASYGALPDNVRDADHWVAVSSELLVHEIGLSGKIEPDKTIVLTAPFEGKILATHVENGERVEKGQPLLTMDPAMHEMKLREALSELIKARRKVQELESWSSSAQVSRARRALRAAEISMGNLDARLRESQSLFNRGIIPRYEVDDLKQQAQMQGLELTAAKGELQKTLEEGQGEHLRIARMELENAEIRHEALRNLLDERIILAPFSGIILPFSNEQSSGAGAPEPLHAGGRVTQGQGLFRLANTEKLKVVAMASELDINKLYQGQEVEITGDGFEGERLSGIVEVVSSFGITDGESGGSADFRVVLSVPDVTDKQLRHVRLGMSARLAITTYRNDKAVIIPPVAVQRDGGAMLVEHREAMDKPIRRVSVSTGRSSLKGVEVFGLPPGFVRVPSFDGVAADP